MSTLHCTRSPIRILREPLRRIGFWTDQSLEYQSQLFTFVDHSSISNAKLLEKAWVTEVTKSLMWQLQISRNHIQLLAVVFSKNWGAAIKWSTYLELPSYETSLMSWSPSTPIRSHSLIVQSSSPFCCSVFFEKWLWWVTSKLKFWSKKKSDCRFLSVFWRCYFWAITILLIIVDLTALDSYTDCQELWNTSYWFFEFSLQGNQFLGQGRCLPLCWIFFDRIEATR